jgi:uncharacterized YccA/Bax inhibitor family protein
MKAILPNAMFIGFTGTPLLKTDKQKSIEIFGGYIHTYKFDEAVKDGVVLDLRYEARYPGIATQAIGLTVAMCFCLLVSYGVGWITLGATFRRKMSMALCGAIAYCAVSILLVLAGVRGVPIVATGIPGGLVSIAVVALPGAALVATCGAVIQRVNEGKPRYLEWYAALGILTSLVWIYYEMLGLLSTARRSS